MQRAFFFLRHVLVVTPRKHETAPMNCPDVHAREAVTKGVEKNRVWSVTSGWRAWRPVRLVICFMYTAMGLYILTYKWIAHGWVWVREQVVVEDSIIKLLSSSIFRGKWANKEIQISLIYPLTSTIAPNGSEFSHRVRISIFLFFLLALSLRKFTGSHCIVASAS